MKPCTLGKRHSWAFMKNVVTAAMAGGGVRISKLGKYRCECGETKLGESMVPYEQEKSA